MAGWMDGWGGWVCGWGVGDDSSVFNLLDCYKERTKKSLCIVLLATLSPVLRILAHTRMWPMLSYYDWTFLPHWKVSFYQHVSLKVLSFQLHVSPFKKLVKYAREMLILKTISITETAKGTSSLLRINFIKSHCSSLSREKKPTLSLGSSWPS